MVNFKKYGNIINITFKSAVKRIKYSMYNTFLKTVFAIVDKNKTLQNLLLCLL